MAPGQRTSPTTAPRSSTFGIVDGRATGRLGDGLSRREVFDSSFASIHSALRPTHATRGQESRRGWPVDGSAAPGSKPRLRVVVSRGRPLHAGKKIMATSQMSDVI